MIAALRAEISDWTSPMSLSMAGICLPTFVLGPLLIFALSTNLGVLPPLVGTDLGTGFSHPRYLGLFYAADIARSIRAGMLETSTRFTSEHQGKGANSWTILTKHAAKGGLFTGNGHFFGSSLYGLITGSFVIESIFIPGLGKFFGRPRHSIGITPWF